MGFIDLHVHSNASDGTLSPRDVVAYALEKQLEAIALTDHDTVAGIKEAQVAAEGTSLLVIPGIELSCLYKEREIHILGYFVPVDDPDFLNQLEYLCHIRSERNLEMIKRFCQGGMEITLEELTGENPETVITRAHFAKVLVAKGYVRSADQAYKKYLQSGSPYYVAKSCITPEYALKLLSGSHAFPVIAHPLQYNMGYREIEEMVAYFKTLGLAGIEVYHSSHNQYQSSKLKVMTKAYGLLPTGGSDFHGANKPDIDIGTGRGGLRLLSYFLDDMEKAVHYAR